MADITKKTTNSKVKKVAKAPKKTIKKAVKKPATKTPKVAKKAAPKKKSVKKKAAKKASKDEYFYLNNGAVVKSIGQLAQMMDEISDELFYHHVNDDRHDFANWINDVFEEAELANQLFEAEKQKEKNHYIVLKYVVKGK